MIVYLPIEKSTDMQLNMVRIGPLQSVVRIFDPRFNLVCIFIYDPVRDPKSVVRSKADDPDENNRS